MYFGMGILLFQSNNTPSQYTWRSLAPPRLYLTTVLLQPNCYRHTSATSSLILRHLLTSSCHSFVTFFHFMFVWYALFIFACAIPYACLCLVYAWMLVEFALEASPFYSFSLGLILLCGPFKLISFHII